LERTELDLYLIKQVEQVTTLVLEGSALPATEHDVRAVNAVVNAVWHRPEMNSPEGLKNGP
jgi:hypothetical protein